MGRLLKWVKTLEDRLTEFERRTNPRTQDPERRAQLPSENRLMLYAGLLVFGLPASIIGLGLLSRQLGTSGLQSILYLFASVVFGINAIWQAFPRFEELGLPMPYPRHRLLPLYLQGIPSVLFSLTVLWHAWANQLWVVIGIATAWLIAFLTLAISKVAIERSRRRHSQDGASLNARQS